jgi:hypothetical protein
MNFLASQKIRILIAVIIVPLLLWHSNGYPVGAANNLPENTHADQSSIAITSVHAKPFPTHFALLQSPSPISTLAQAPAANLSESFQKFRQQVANKQAGVLRGVYVEDVLALPIVQQPRGESLYVDDQNGTATQFQPAAQRGVTGILAHNFLSGALFFKLKIGETVHLVFGDGRTESYQISDIQRYQKLSPLSLYSRFIDLQSNQQISSNELFQRVYSGPDHVTFQTCLEKDGNWSWGLIFIIATKV